jgi:hypothetical protein
MKLYRFRQNFTVSDFATRQSLEDSLEDNLEHYDYPTKMVGSETFLKSLDDITKNIVADDEKVLEDMSDNIRRASAEQIKYFLDPSMFRNDGSLSVSIGGAWNLFIADPNVPPPKRLHPTRSSRGPPWMAEIDSGLLMKVRAGFMPNEVMKRLESIPVRKKRFKLISLINDLSTETALENSSLASRVVKLSTLTEDSIRNVFRKNSRGVIAVLGHAEDDHFIVKDLSGSRILLDLPMAKLADFAQETACELIYLGCSAGRESGGIGAADPFNPIYAVQRLAQVIDLANYRAFFEQLAGPELSLVLDDTAFSQAAGNAAREVKFEILDRAWGSEQPITGAIRLPPQTSGWLIAVPLLIAIAVLILALMVRYAKNGSKRTSN